MWIRIRCNVDSNPGYAVSLYADPDAVPDPWSKRSILFLTKFLCNRFIVMWIRVGCHVDPDPG